MNKDLEKFTQVINHLIFLTTNDEYGSTRSRGVETLADLAAELNAVGISAPRDGWSESKLKIHFHRIKQRYTYDEMISECDLDLISRSAWEYSSCTRHEDILRNKKCGTKIQSKSKIKEQPVIKYEPMCDESWKDTELQDVIQEDKRSLKKYRNKCRKMKPKKKD